MKGDKILENGGRTKEMWKHGRMVEERLKYGTGMVKV